MAYQLSYDSNKALLRKVIENLISPNLAMALKVLWIHGPCYGLEVVEKSENLLKVGSVHFLLTRAEADGLVSSIVEQAPSGRFPKRRYALTTKGEEALHQFLNRHRTLLFS